MNETERDGVNVIEFRVNGLPRPGGSKKAFVNRKTGRAMIVDASKHIRDWKQAVKEEAIKYAPKVPLDVPLSLKVIFIMPRPQSHFRTGKHVRELRENAPTWHTSKPDASKLLRGTEDALTGIIWRDDSRISRQEIEKRYGDRPGAEIKIEWEGE